MMSDNATGQTEGETRVEEETNGPEGQTGLVRHVKRAMGVLGYRDPLLWGSVENMAAVRLRRSIRTTVLMVLDALAAGGTLALLIFGFGINTPVLAHFGWQQIVLFGSFVTLCFFFLGAYRRSWRFVSIADVLHMVGTLVGALVSTWLVVLDLSKQLSAGLTILPVAILHFCLLTLTMMAMRLVRRGLREAIRRWPGASRRRVAENARNTLLLGEPEWAVSVINMVKSGKGSPMNVVGILLPHRDDTITRLAGVPVFGGHKQLKDAVSYLAEKRNRPDSIIVCDDGTNLSHRELAKIVHRARELGLIVSRINDPLGQLLQGQSRIDLDSVPLTELLGRNEITMEKSAVVRQIEGQCVLVTGAGGTIGGELARQLAGFRPSRLVLVDHAEFNLYSIEMALKESFPELDCPIELCNIRDATDVRRVFARHRPAIVYHAAALKHVPMVEANPCAGVYTNIIGTKIVADAVCEFNVRAMVQVSTDKAVNPVGMMGATKRVGELYCQSLDLCGVDDSETPRFMTVRFGNVLGSSGSVVPLFKRQLLEGRPLTVTHPQIERFFMTVSEAVQLILESSSRAMEENTTRGNIFVLDMGKPVKIVDLARRMIRLFGLEPDVDVPIQFTGLRPGEKLFEELFDSCEQQVESGITGLFEAHSKPIPLPLIAKAIEQLHHAVVDGDAEAARVITHNLVKLPSSGVDMTSLMTRSNGFWRGNWPRLAMGV